MSGTVCHLLESYNLQKTKEIRAQSAAHAIRTIVTGEALFRAAYTTSQNTISDLGSTWQPGDIVREPSATIFNTAMLVSGAMIVAAAAAYWRAYRSRSVAIALLLLGVGMLGVGSFPGTEIGGHPSTAGLHPPLSMLTFIAGGLCGVLAYRVTTAPFRYVSVMLGVVSLGSLVLSGPLSASDLGAGGVERWVAYPVVLWVVAFGGYLLGAAVSGTGERRRDSGRPGERDAMRVLSRSPAGTGRPRRSPRRSAANSPNGAWTWMS